MPTTFFNLTNRLLRRLNEVEIADASNFSTVRGVQAFARDAINSAIETICQAEFTWPFNAVSATQVLTKGQTQYDWPADMKLPNWRSFTVLRNDTLAEHGHVLTFISRDIWNRDYKTDDLYAVANGIRSPVFVFEKHGFGFGVTPAPDKAYTVSFDYWASAVTLVAATDISRIPSNYDEVIIQAALYHFYMFRDNIDQASITSSEFKKALGNMRTILINKEDRVRGSFNNTYPAQGIPSIKEF